MVQREKGLTIMVVEALETWVGQLNHIANVFIQPARCLLSMFHKLAQLVYKVII
jgi:hypothetical protein